MGRNYTTTITFGSSQPSVESQEKAEEFKQFEALTTKLVSVPKPEVDSKRKKRD